MQGQRGGRAGGSNRDPRAASRDGKMKEYRPVHSHQHHHHQYHHSHKTTVDKQHHLRGKQQQQQHIHKDCLYLPMLPSHHHSHSRRQPPPQHGNYGYEELQREYMLPDQPSNLGRTNVEPPPFGSVKIAVEAMSAAELESQDFMDQRPETTYLTGNPNQAVVETENTMGDGSGCSSMARASGSSHDAEVLPYHDHVRPYERMATERLYARHAPYIPHSHASHYRPVSRSPSSSSAVMMDEAYDMHFDHHLHPPTSFAKGSRGRFLDTPLEEFTDELAKGSHGRFLDTPLEEFTDEPLDQVGYNEMPPPQTVRRVPHGKHPRGEPIEYGMHELGRTELEDQGLFALDDRYERMPLPRGPRAEIRYQLGSPPYASLPDEMVSGAHFSRRMAAERGIYHHVHHRLHHPDAAIYYHERNGVQGDYTGSSRNTHVGFAGRPLHRHQVASFEEEGYSSRDAEPVVYGDRFHSPIYAENEMDVYQDDVSPREWEYHDDQDAYDYDLTPKRLFRREYVMVDDMHGYSARTMRPNEHCKMFRRTALADDADEEGFGEYRENHLHYEKLPYGRPKYKMIPQKSAAWLQPSGSSIHERGGQVKSVKKRLNPAPPHYHGQYASERNEFFSPHKVWKRSMENKQNGSATNSVDVPEDENLRIKEGPQEGSEEFKQQVQQAFLKFSKMLNESETMQKRYRELGKVPLLCCVCGSHSKEFADAHSLVTHTYHTCKVSLKTKHRGLHKALCLLMGWNWLIAPDTSLLYQHSIPGEANALKEDLILWPPLTIIHNGSIGSKATANQPKVMSVEDIEGALRGIGVEPGKSKATLGKPANQSVFLVKFLPTFSGLQQAEKIHKYFADQKRGKQEFQHLKSGKAKADARVEKIEELLYGYLAVAEDLVNLDDKRCVVRSKKDIVAIADAPLKSGPLKSGT